MNLMVVGLGFEPRLRTNLVLTVYKTAILPLEEPTIFIFLITPYIFQ